MKLSRLYVDNFKAAKGVELELSHMTTLVGANGSGKTTFLEALDYFFHPEDIPYEDYNDPNSPIKIAVTFTRVPQSNSPVKITRTCTWQGGKTNVDTEDTSFKLASNENILGSVHVVFERAEHETDEDGTSKSELDLFETIKETIRKEIATADLESMFAASREYYQSLNAHLEEFKSIMNKKMAGGSSDSTGYAPGSTVDFDIRDPNPEPDIDAVFVEPNRRLAHKLAGHGTKRAYHMAALETYAEILSKRRSGTLVLLLVDEPELHQHPQRQRHILQTYKKIARSSSFQIVYSTHSPEMVDLDRPEGIYKITRNQESGIVANSGVGLAPKLSSWNIHKKLVEGIFSAGAVVVEGWRDEAVLGAALSAVKMGDKTVLKKFIENDINIVYATSVSCIPDFVKFFRALGVPVFAVWDADGHDSGHKQNRDILSSLEVNAEFVASNDHGAHNFGPNFFCYASDADLYFKKWLGFPDAADTKGQKKSIKDEIVNNYEGLAHAFDSDEFRATEFATSVVPHMCGHFPLS